MCEWAIASEKGSVLQKTINQIDCHNPKLAEFGGADCDWACEKVIGKGEGQTPSQSEDAIGNDLP
jgi:hypothetical protein